MGDKVTITISTENLKAIRKILLNLRETELAKNQCETLKTRQLREILDNLDSNFIY